MAQRRIGDDELAGRRERFLVAETRARFHLYEVMPQVLEDLKEVHGFISQRQLMWTMSRTKQDWGNHFARTKDHRRGPSFAEIQGLIHAWDLPAQIFDVDFSETGGL